MIFDIPIQAFLGQLLIGLINGSFYAMLSLGLAIIFGLLNDHIEAVGLQDAHDCPAADLSYGRKRVLEIATTLALDPKVLLLDEPMAGMGHEDVEVVAALVREVAATRAVLMVEHNLKVVADLCDEVTVLQHGEILTSGDYRSVSEDPRVREAYMGTDHD